MHEKWIVEISPIGLVAGHILQCIGNNHGRIVKISSIGFVADMWIKHLGYSLTHPNRNAIGMVLIKLSG